MNITSFDHIKINAQNVNNTTNNKVMIVMHGLGDVNESYVPFAGELNVTGLSYLLINAPRPYIIGRSWYDIPPGNPAIGIKDSSNRLSELLNELNSQGLSDEDIFICGFSQGGCIALHSFFHLNRKLGGVICLSPRVYFNLLPRKLSNEAKKTPIFMAHGEFDPVIPFLETSEGRSNLEKLGLTVDFFAYEMEHEIDAMEMIDLRSWINELL